MAATRAQAARDLILLCRRGVLATNSLKWPGFPQGSVMPYAVDDAGQPFFFLSALALHTKNLLVDPHASLLVVEENAGSDPLALARANVFGLISVVNDDREVSALRRQYVAVHRAAEQWMDFSDFCIFRMEVTAVYYVGGFGEMGWVEATEYRSAVL